MNANRLLLSAIFASTCLSASIAVAGPRASGGSARAAHSAISHPTFTASNHTAMTSTPRLTTTMGTRPVFTPRNSVGLNSNTGLTANRSAFTQRFNQNSRFSQRLSTTNGSARSASTRNWSGNNGNWNHHHHHHRGSNFVFVGGGFYPYSWYYPYDYGYYSYAQPLVYEDVASYGDGGSLVAEVQTTLARAGFYRGAIDGVMGPQTRRAIRAYERARGLPVDGEIDNQLLGTMGLG